MGKGLRGESGWWNRSPLAGDHGEHAEAAVGDQHAAIHFGRSEETLITWRSLPTLMATSMRDVDRVPIGHVQSNAQCQAASYT